MTQPRTSRIPAPIYAAAGAGELAYESLRRLPVVLTDFSGKLTDISGKAASTGTELREKAVSTLRTANTTAINLRGKATTRDLELDRLRAAAIRNAAVVVTNAQAAQERAVTVYGALVARGERIIGSGVVQAAETVTADMAATEAPAQVTASPATPATPATVAEAVDATPAAKRPRAARAGKAADTAVDGGTPSAKLPKASAKRTNTGDN